MEEGTSPGAPMLICDGSATTHTTLCPQGCPLTAACCTHFSVQDTSPKEELGFKSHRPTGSYLISLMPDFAALGLFSLQGATGSCILQHSPGAGPEAELLPGLPKR